VMILAPSYRESAVVMPFLVLIPVMTTISTVTGIGISLKRRTEFHTLVTGLTALLNFTGNVILVPKYGAIGASIATGVSYIFMFVLRTFISHKLFPVNYPFSFIFSNILLVSLSAFVNLLPWFYVSMILQVGIFSLLVLINIRNIILLLRAGMNILKKIRKKMVK
ncbi:MAG: lipopolysaccharide biosynthesis protein, partial [Thermotoga sp.]